MNGAELLVAGLEAEGVTHVFGVPGEENLHLIEALRTSPISFVVSSMPLSWLPRRGG